MPTMLNARQRWRATGRMVMRSFYALVVAALVFAPLAIAEAQPLKSEPRDGDLLEGARVLVDDGTCPSGEIKEVTGGNLQTRRPRIRKCIPRADERQGGGRPVPTPSASSS